MIRAILFDADGVLQKPSVDWWSALGRLITHSGPQDVDAFVSDVFSAEEPSLTGTGDFGAELAVVLSRWGCPERLNDCLSIWTSTQTEAPILETVQSIRKRGVPCYVASNQQAHRAEYMSDRLGYKELFDGEFYSFSIGWRKPNPTYFQSILTQLNLPPDSVAFVDDRQDNVDSATALGMHSALFSLESGVDRLGEILRTWGLSWT